MNQLLFFETNKLNALLTDLYQQEGNTFTYKTSFHEEWEMDVVEVYIGQELQEMIPFTHVLPKIEERFQVTITDYDVTEINDDIGFVFYMEVHSVLPR